LADGADQCLPDYEGPPAAAANTMFSDISPTGMEIQMKEGKFERAVTPPTTADLDVNM